MFLKMAHNLLLYATNVITKMRQQTEILQIRVTPEIIHYLDVLNKKYKIKRSQFVRNAIVEKTKRDISKIREENKKEYLPF